MTFLLRFVGAALAFLYTAVITRQIGVEDSGYYFLSLSAAMFLSTVARAGMDNAVVRFAAVTADQKNWIGLRGMFHLIVGVVGVLSFTIAVPVLVYAPEISELIWGNPAASPIVRFFGISIVSFSLMTILSEFLRAIGELTASVLVSSILHTAVAIALLITLVHGFGAGGAALTFLIATSFSAAMGALWWRRCINLQPMVGHRLSLNPMLQSARHLFIIALAGQAIIPYGPTILIGFWGTADDAAIFSVATRIGMIVGLMLVAVNIIVAPRIAQLYEHRNLKQLEVVVRSISFFLASAAALIVLVGIMLSESLMGVFGEDFRVGGNVLSVILAGQFINVATGSVGVLLMMTGHERQFKQLTLASSVILIVLCFLLIPHLGGVGAAVAVAVSTAILNISALYVAQLRLGIRVSPLPAFKKSQR